MKMGSAVPVKLLLAMATLLCVIQCDQDSPAKADRSNFPVSNAGASVPRPEDEAMVVRDAPTYVINGPELDSLLKLSRPTFVFVFETVPEHKGTLPQEAEAILDRHWSEAIKFFHAEAYDSAGSAQRQLDRDSVWSRYCGATDHELQKIVIHAPTGLRNISQTESMDLWGSLNKAAVDLVKRSKNQHS